METSTTSVKLSLYQIRKNWLTIVCFSALFALLFLSYFSRQTKLLNDPYSVRVAALISDQLIASLDPVKIDSFRQAFLLNNIYSRLLEYDLTGNIQLGVASKFYWEKNNLLFEFDPHKAITANNKSVNAFDAAVSIRRALKLSVGNYKNLLQIDCKLEKASDVFENCESIKVLSNKLIISLKSEKFKQFIMQALATGPFAIVPQDAINKVDLKITNYNLTSGPYYLISGNGKFLLKRNSEHYRVGLHAPEVIELIPTSGIDTGKLILENKVDVIPTGFNITKSTIELCANTVEKFKVFETGPIKLFYLVFSPNALTKFNADDLKLIGLKVRELFRAKYDWPYHSAVANEFFGDMGFGHLSKNQILNNQNEEARLLKNSNRKIKNKASFYFYDFLSQRLQGLTELKELKLVKTSNEGGPFTTPLNERLDLSFVAADTAFEEDVALVNYNFLQGTFGVTPSEGQVWLEKYITTVEIEERAQMLQALQLSAIKRGVLVPLMKSPFTILLRNGFTIEQSKIFASTQLWRIRKL